MKSQPIGSRRNKRSQGKQSANSSRPLMVRASSARLSMQALEPRVLLDAAAAQTAQEAAQAADAMAPEAQAQMDEANAHHAGLIDALSAVQQQERLAGQPAAQAERTEVYFIDRSVAEAEVLASSVPEGAEIHFIDAEVDGVDFVARTVQGRSDIGAIHILGHGQASALQLGSASLTAQSMQGEYRDNLSIIGGALADSADILIYGCDFGAGETGLQTAQLLAQLTGADVAASNDPTGAAALGGDWDLEVRSGTIETAALEAPEWAHLLAAPVLDTTPDLSYTATEDQGAPTGAVGQLVSSYAVGITDADGDPGGIAITASDTANGTWFYSTDDGGTWSAVGAVSENSALLLADDGSTRLYFQPNAEYSGTVANGLTILAWDQSEGTAGQKEDITASGAVSATSDTVSLTVNAVNDAPVLSGSAAYSGSEDSGPAAGPVGQLVSSFTGGITDADASDPRGIAITSVSTTNGQWFYSTNGGASWTVVGAVSQTSALLLGTDGQSRLYFEPNANFNGSVANALTFRAWDQSTGTAGTKTTASPNGGSGAFSSGSAIVTVNIASANDAPVLAEQARTLTTITEDNNGAEGTVYPIPVGAVGTAVSGFIGANSDVDASPATGIAIVAANAANGTWWYSIDNGTTWLALGGVSESNALLLVNSADSRMYFQPDADYNAPAGTPLADALTIRAWDQSQGANGGRFDVAAAGTGGTSAFSAQTDTVSQQINAVADIAADTINGINAAVEDTDKVFNPILGTGGATADRFEGANPQITAIAGQAIAPGGSVTTTNGTVTLGADGQTLTFHGAADFNGIATFSYTVTSGGASETANISVTVTAVPDAPRVDLDGTTDGRDYATTYDEQVVAIGRLISVTDPENEGIASMTVTLSGTSAEDSLFMAGVVRGITANYDTGTRVLTLTGNSSLANYQAALRQVYFTTTSADATARTVSVQATSQGTPKLSDVAVATITPVDSDRDGVINSVDIDDDNDGIVDVVERNPSGTLDPELVSDAELVDGSGWTYNSGFERWNGGVELEGAILADRNTPSYIEQSIQTVPGQIYRFNVSMYARSGAPHSERVSLQVDGVEIGQLSSSTPFSSYLSTPPDEIYVDFLATGANTVIRVQSLASSARHPYPLPGDGWGEILQAVSVKMVAFVDRDTDNDGVIDRVDLDADNDGIGDNIEAQGTAGYKAPSGQSAAMVDDDRDGLDDRYDADSSDTRVEASLGLTPVDTDQDGIADYRDSDSDSDGRLDVAERGDDQSVLVSGLDDQDNDGLLDIFEHGTPDDGFFVHDGTVSTSGGPLDSTVTSFGLADSDDDTAADGSDAVPLYSDFNWRDLNPALSRVPLIDLNSGVSAPDGTRDFNTRASGAGGDVNVAASIADVSEFGDEDLISLTIAVGGVQDGASEVLNLGGADFALNADCTQTITVDGIALQVNYTVAGGFSITSAPPGTVVPQSALDTLVRGMTYANTLVTATSGARTLTFVVSDIDGNSSGPAVSTIQVTPNGPPVAADDASTVLEDQQATGDVLDNDSDPDARDVLAVTEFTVNGSIFAAGSTAPIPGVGTITIGTDGSFVFTPELHYHGPVPPIQYTVQDPQGNTASAQLTIEIIEQNDPPVPGEPPGGTPPGQPPFDPVTGSYNGSTMEDQPIEGRVAGNDPDGDALTYTLAQGPTNGSLTVDANGAYIYTPTPDFNGNDSFIVTISDGRGASVQATVNIEVTPVADALDDAFTTPEDTPVTIDVNANDSFEDAGHRLAAIDGNAIVVGQRVTVANGTVMLNADGTLEFAPALNFNGITSFSYTVSAGGVQETATVRVDVSAVNDPPVPRNPGTPGNPGAPGEPGGPGDIPGQSFDPDTGNYFITTPQDIPFDGRVEGSDPDGDPLTYTVAGNPGNGTVVLQPDGRYTYTPNTGFVGNDSFEVTISDGNGGFATSTVFITVTQVSVPRDDYPFVYYPGDDDGGGDDPGGRDDSELDFDPSTIEAVNGVRTLNGTRTLDATSGVMLQAVNGVDSLNGTVPLTARGPVLQAVNGVASLNGIDTVHRQSSAVERAALQAEGTDSTGPAFISSLRVGDGLALELSGDQGRVWLSVEAGTAVREVRASLAGGGALPAWVQVDPRGFVTMDRPADAQKLRLRLTVVPERGASRSVTVEVDFDSGQMRQVGGRDAQRAGSASGAAHNRADALDFAAQLAMAVNVPVHQDAELLGMMASQ